VLVVVVTALLVSHFRDDAGYRDGTAPERHGVVVAGPAHRHMTCGRSQDGYQVEVSYTVAGAIRTAALPSCDPDAHPRGTFVDFWEQRPGLLTTTPPGDESHLLPWAIAVLVVLWAAVVGFVVRRPRRSAGGPDLVAQ